MLSPAEPEGPETLTEAEPTRELDRLIGAARQRLADDTRLRALLAAGAVAAADVSLPQALRQIVRAARDLVEADFAMLGVAGRGGELALLVHAGLAEPLVERMREVRRRPGSSRHHRPVGRCVHVDLRARGAVLGQLWLRVPGSRSCTVEDRELLRTLAATAGLLIALERAPAAAG